MPTTPTTVAHSATSTTRAILRLPLPTTAFKPYLTRGRIRLLLLPPPPTILLLLPFSSFYATLPIFWSPLLSARLLSLAVLLAFLLPLAHPCSRSLPVESVALAVIWPPI